MINVSKYVDFYVDVRHSNKKNTDFYPLIVKINDVEIFIGFINKSQYDLLVATTN